MTTAAPRSLPLALGAQVVIRVLGLIAGLATVAVQGRALGATEFATLSMLLAISLAGQTFVDLGLGKVATQKVAADPTSAPVVAGSVMLARLSLGVVAAVIGTSIGGAITGNAAGFLASLLVCLGLPLSSVTVLQALSEAKLDIWAVNLIVFTQNGVWLAIVSLLYVFKAGLLGFAAGYAVAACLQATVVWLLAVRGVDIRLRGAANQAWRLLKASIPLGIGAIAVTAYYRLTGIVLFERVGAQESAGYFAAMRLIDAGQVLPATIGGVVLPLLSAAIHRDDRRQALAVWDIALRVLLSAAAVVIGFVVVVPGEVLTLLFGPSFEGRGTELRWLILAYLPVCVGWVVTSALIAAGELRRYSTAVVVVAVLSLVALFAGIDRLGAPWAVAVTLGTEAVSVGTLACLVRARVGLGFPAAVLMQAVLLGLSVAGVAWLGSHIGLAASLAGVVVVAPALIMVIGLVRPATVVALRAARQPEGVAADAPLA